MKTYGLSYGDVAALLRYENGRIYWRINRGGVLAGSEAGSFTSGGYTKGRKPYRFVRINKRPYMTANVVFLLCNRRWPTSTLDHQDGDPLNNRIENLRECGQAENVKNLAKSKRNTSGIMGVGWHKKAGKWRAYIRAPEGIRHLGLFVDIEEAARVRREAQNALGYHPNHGREPA